MEKIGYVPRPVQVDPNIYMVQAQASPATQMMAHHFAQAATQVAEQ